MNATDQILAEALKLPDSDRAEIADPLTRSLGYDREAKDQKPEKGSAAKIAQVLVSKVISRDCD